VLVKLFITVPSSFALIGLFFLNYDLKLLDDGLNQEPLQHDVESFGQQGPML
jgi:hypothetical protein